MKFETSNQLTHIIKTHNIKEIQKKKMTYFDKIWFFIDIYPSFQEDQS